MIKKCVKKTIATIALLISIILISSSSLSVKLSDKSEIYNFSFENHEEETNIQKESLTALDPKWKDSKIAANSLINPIKQSLQSQFTDIMHGFIAYGGSSGEPEGPCYLYLDDPGDIISLAFWDDTFIAGGTWTCDERWLGCQYSTGCLWTINPDTGDMEQIGGGGISCNGLAWDPLYCRLYGASNTHLIEYDPETGEQETIGSFGLSGKTIIGIAINLDGVAYIWDVLFSGESTLWTCDLETGEATEVGSMGEPLVYAQDGAFDYDTGILWLTAYYSSGFLATVDIETGELTHMGDFEGGAEITGSMIASPCSCQYHDVGVTNIIYPESGYALPEIPMQVTVKNYKWYTEITDVQMQVNKFEAGPLILEEDFSGLFPPEGWSTDWWEQSDTDYSCGIAPEAHCNKYTQANQGDYYDNYIMTTLLDCSNIQAVKLSFKLSIDILYNNYCSFYIKWREDSNSSWKDITPWDNPLPWDIECEPFSITIYGGPYLGEEFQVKWEYIGYYYYFNDFYIDNVTIIGGNCLDEYNEVVEDIEVEPGEEVIVDFPTWTPSYWQDSDYENTWQEIPVKACTLLEGDDYLENDCKRKNVDLYFPWMHDIEITNIYPCEDGPGKTYPVEATITNVGQHSECCIPIDISISEPVVLDTFIDENTWNTVPPDGWYDEHKDHSENYGWTKSNTSWSGGSSPEARLRYYQAKPEHIFYSYAIDTSHYSSCQLEFKSYINHYTGSGLYALEAGYSHDKETWYAVWHEEPSSNRDYDVSITIEGGFETTHIGFWVKGDPYYFNYWYIDDVSVKVLDFVLEYSDFKCQVDNLNPGESITFDFDDWTPDFLQYETSGSKDYIIQAEIGMNKDKNPSNDMKSIYFTLDYWHDVGIHGASSPIYENGRNYFYWDNGEPNGENALPGSIYKGYSNIIIDDFSNEKNWYPTDVEFRFIWNSGYGAGNLEYVIVYFFEDEGDCNPSQDEYAILDIVDFFEWNTGNYYFGRPEIACHVSFWQNICLPSGIWWIGIQPLGIEDDIAYLLTADGFGCSVMADLPYWGYPRWTSSREIWNRDYDLSWKLWCYSCQPPIVYIQPGTENISAIVKNHGTFSELNLTCYAEIVEYITDPYGKLVYEDNITNIGLDEPLGGEEMLEFEDYKFSMEGRYCLSFEIPAPIDDEPDNNFYRQGIFADDTAPISTYELWPEDPDGENGWYVEDVEVTLQAYDPYVKDVSSGVDAIKYKVNDGPIETIPYSYGRFFLTQENEGDDVLVEYWAIDNVGNEETPHNTFTIDMDQTNPNIDLTYEVAGGNPIQGWTMLFTATATDANSGMDRVEFFFNNEWQKTVTGPGPIYEWSFIYHGDLSIDIGADAYDIAGNMASDLIEDPKSTSYNYNNQNSHHQSQIPKIVNIINNKTSQRLYVIYGGEYK